MMEKGGDLAVLHGLEIIRESFVQEGMPFHSRSVKKSYVDCEFDVPAQKDFVEERELFDVFSLEERDNVPMEVPRGTVPKPFACIGSYRQKHGDNLENEASFLLDASGTLGPEISRVSSAPIGWRPEMTVSDNGVSSPAVDIPRKDTLDVEGSSGRKKFLKGRTFASRGSREEAREEAWVRRRDRVLLDEMNEINENMKAKAVGRSVSDCGDRTWPLHAERSHVRTRSLTDEDLDELRGCIDLGFGFSNDHDLELRNTLPALELCYAISQQYKDAPRLSPVSTLESNDILDGSTNGSSLQTSPMESWRIASPGDHPSQVKNRLRHWAQAVACTVRQSC